jgi:hypothetical protein
MHNGDELKGLMMNAGFEDIEVHQTQRTLRLPEPEDFLWQYIHSTPLAALVGMATDKQRADLTDDVSACWQEFVVDGGLNLELRISTVCGKVGVRDGCQSLTNVNTGGREQRYKY